MRGILSWAAFVALLTGCREKPVPPPTLADLRFPVVVNYQRGGVVIFPDATSLGMMSLGQMHAITEPPPLIDSSFAVYTLADLRSTHGTLWLMANPTGYTPVTFTLQRAPKTGIDAARAILRTRLDDQTWRRDLDEQRRALAAAKTLTEMVTIVNSQQTQ